ncbi:DUF1553 domain-containing protein [Lentisphaerota bacterium WC36G]|nr:DUF1553 domain-containing protein [Lentisphaerae bacterium WC36]
MKKLVVTVSFIILCGIIGMTSHAQKYSVFEKTSPQKINKIDDFIIANLTKKNIQRANLCSDAVFIRRLYIDVIGTMPTAKEVKEFLADKRTNKRALLINKVLQRSEFADYWSLKWCDILRVKSEFPINLWPNAVQAYHKYIHESLSKNIPYNKFSRELLLANGSNFKVPQSNFYRAVQSKTPEGIARAVSLTFMGIRYEKQSSDFQKNLATAFSQVKYKGTDEWKEEIVYQDYNLVDDFYLKTVDGQKILVKKGVDPRVVFTDWLVAKDNKLFNRNIVNRIWYWLMNRGLIHEADNLPVDTNNTLHQDLLDYLEQELVNNSYNLKHIYRIILNSATYQQSSVARTKHKDAEKYFAYYISQRLDAEVLIDMIDYLGGTGQRYSSVIPEPFTYIPVKNRTITLADASIGSSFLENFGRPSRDMGYLSERKNFFNDIQRLYLINSTKIQNSIFKIIKKHKYILKSSYKIKGFDARIKYITKELFILILSRYPSTDELELVVGYCKQNGAGKNFYRSINDIVWTILNSEEFLMKH